MKKLDGFIEFIKPSVTGLAMYFIVALLILVVNAHYFNSLISSAINGNGPQASMHVNSFLSWTNHQLLHYFGVNTSINLVVGLIWGAVGLVVYVICVIIYGFIKRTREVYKLKEYTTLAHVSKSQFIINPLERLLTQLFTTIILIIYIVKLMVPLVLGYILPLPKNGTNNFLPDLLRVLVYLIVLHGFVLLLRIVFLHERLGEEVELSERHNL